MLRRLVLTAAAAVAALSAAPVVAQADARPVPLPLPLSIPGPDGDAGESGSGDRLTVTVSHAAGDANGTYELSCRPAGGDHPDPAGGCERLEQLATDGEDPFAPVRKDAMCTMQHGGDATARVTGTWHGRAVEASFERTDGCEISRWNQLVPVLPST